jgi:hypothetical protein
MKFRTDAEFFRLAIDVIKLKRSLGCLAFSAAITKQPLSRVSVLVTFIGVVPLPL